MNNINEKDKIINSSTLVIVKPMIPYIEFKLKLNCGYIDSISKVKEVVSIINLANSFDDWPEDDWWTQSLPSWFLNSFDKTIEEIQKNKELWHFGSWIDAIKYRQWEWYGVDVKKDQLSIFIELHDYPCVIEPLEFIIRQAGFKSFSLIEY